MRRLGQQWIKIAEKIGTVQMIIVLSLVYWLFLAPIAIVFKFISDPLSLRKPEHARWLEREKTSTTLESMKKQY